MNDKRVIDWSSFRVELNGLGAVDSFDITLPWEVTELSPRDDLLYSSPTKSSDLVFGQADIKGRSRIQRRRNKDFNRR